MVKAFVYKGVDGKVEDWVWRGGVDCERDWGKESDVRKEGSGKEER